MGAKSTIEWTDASWNNLRGCQRISPGCGGAVGVGGCYAEKMAARFSDEGQPFHGFAIRTPNGAKWTGKVSPWPEKLSLPLTWEKPRKVFVNSMSDLFHEDVPFDYIAAVFGVMAACPQHTFQVLTKRADRMAEWFEWMESADAFQRVARHTTPWGGEPGERPPGWAMRRVAIAAARQANTSLGRFDRWTALDMGPWPLPNVHVGVSVENQQYADERIPHLLRCPAAVRFLSVEPMLGSVDLSQWLWRPSNPLEFEEMHRRGDFDFEGLHWVIAGSESGNGARPMNEDWVRSIRDQCAAAGVQFFYKQRTEGRKVVSLPILDGVQHAAFPVMS